MRWLKPDPALTLYMRATFVLVAATGIVMLVLISLLYGWLLFTDPWSGNSIAFAINFVLGLVLAATLTYRLFGKVRKWWRGQ
jgi:hypothetical protein